MYRIINFDEQFDNNNNNGKTSQSERPPLLMMPGMFQNFDAFLFEGWHKHKSVALQAFDAGYDVWIGNNRGSWYSHGVIQNAFDWADQAQHDLPNMIETVLKNSQYEKLDYIGYAQGSTQMFYGMSYNNEFYEDRVNVFASLAPCTRMVHTKNEIFVSLAHFYK